MITTTIKPFKLDEVRTELSEQGIQGLTVTKVKGAGKIFVTELEQVIRIRTGETGQAAV